MEIITKHEYEIMNKLFPKRKPTRFDGFPYTGKSYFITICVKNKIPKLGYVKLPHDAPAEVILNDLGQYVNHILQKHKQIQMHVVMPNHVHFLATCLDDETPIDQVVRNFKQRTSMYHGESLWQSSYYDQIIRNDKHFETAWWYIEHNAETWRGDKYFISCKYE